MPPSPPPCALGGVVQVFAQGIQAALLALREGTQELSWVQLNAMQLMAQEGVVPMAELSRALPLAPSSTTYVVDHLVALGLVLRGEDPQDRRRVRVRLSAEGERCLRRFVALRDEALIEALRRLEGPNRAAAEAGLRHMLATLTPDGAAAPAAPAR